jgi:hypothetical protein
MGGLNMASAWVVASYASPFFQTKRRRYGSLIGTLCCPALESFKAWGGAGRTEVVQPRVGQCSTAPSAALVSIALAALPASANRPISRSSGRRSPRPPRASDHCHIQLLTTHVRSESIKAALETILATLVGRNILLGRVRP